MSALLVTTCSVIIDEQLPSLLTAVEKALEICLKRDKGHESPVGPTTIYQFFKEENTFQPCKMTGFVNHYESDVLDLQFSACPEQTLIFCSVVDDWAGTVLQRTGWS
jgi:hypothetical protein